MHWVRFEKLIFGMLEASFFPRSGGKISLSFKLIFRCTCHTNPAMILGGLPIVSVLVIFAARMLELGTKRDVIAGKVRENLTFRLFLLAGVLMLAGGVTEFVLKGMVIIPFLSITIAPPSPFISASLFLMTSNAACETVMPLYSIKSEIVFAATMRMKSSP